MFDNSINTTHKTRRVNIKQRTIKGNKQLKGSLKKKCIFLLVLIFTFLIGYGTYFYLETFKKQKNPLNLEPKNMKDLQPSKPNNSPKSILPVKPNNDFYSVEGVFVVSYLPRIKITLEDTSNKSKIEVMYLQTNKSFLMLNNRFVPQNISEKQKQEYYLLNQHLEKVNCPISSYKDYLCISRTHKKKILTNVVGILYLIDENSGSQKFPIISEIVLQNKWLDDKNTYRENVLPVLSIGFLNSNFKSNTLFDGVLTHLERAHNKKIPQTFSVFFERKKFSIFVGKEICENEYVSVKLIERMNYNVLEVKSIYINESKVTETPTFLYFGIRKNTQTYLSSVYFDNFINVLKKEMDDLKRIGGRGTYTVENRFSGKKEVKITASKYISSSYTHIIFNLNNARMIFPLKSLLPRYLGKMESHQGFFFESKRDYSEFCFHAIGKCFDFYIDGDKNTIGFKEAPDSNETCSFSIIH